MQQHNPNATSSTAHQPGGRLGAGSDGSEAINSPTDALRDASARIAELKDFVAYYLAAKTDGIKASVRNLVLYAVLGVVGLMALAGIVITASVLLVQGIAIGLTWLFGGHMATGYVVASLLVLGAIFGGAFLGIQMLTKSSRKQTKEKYEHWKQEQRFRFGTDVRQQAENTRK
ncbi:MAG TPA: hypothetical protein VF669_06875 [Tepidisphaeraceae bacterium]|jgi:hypothetical protein